MLDSSFQSLLFEAVNCQSACTTHPVCFSLCRRWAIRLDLPVVSLNPSPNLTRNKYARFIRSSQNMTTAFWTWTRSLRGIGREDAVGKTHDGMKVELLKRHRRESVQSCGVALPDVLAHDQPESGLGGRACKRPLSTSWADGFRSRDWSIDAIAMRRRRPPERRYALVPCAKWGRSLRLTFPRAPRLRSPESKTRGTMRVRPNPMP
jgi:hypothetical protein